MTDLVKVKGNDIFTDSMVIAEGTGIAHRKLKVTIKKYEGMIKRLGLLAPYRAESSGGRPEEYYRLNEEQATFIMTLLKNTDRVVEFKMNLVQQFYAMRRFLMERQSADWQVLRQQSKEVRRLETDTIQQFVEYARSHGSTHAAHYYTNLTKLVNKAAGIQTRNLATGLQLNTVMFLERMIGEVIRLGMAQGKEYRDIYDLCKSKVLTIRELALLEAAA